VVENRQSAGSKTLIPVNSKSSYFQSCFTRNNFIFQATLKILMMILMMMMMMNSRTLGQ